MEETKRCPYCGEEILAIAKKCKHCGECLDTPETKIAEPIKMDYITHEPTFLQKLAQVYWANPKSWLLKRFQVDGDQIKIETINGNSLSASIDECVFKYQKDQYDRHEIMVKSGNQKLHFKEIPYMLSDEEWESIVDFCLNRCSAKKSTLGKITSVLLAVKNMDS